ncbi:tetratricopeptide repeat protein [Chloroflexi bacterium TSY]|nr:tetratricopeptide repeat protein [Chloroflexi bacterium TSY]
MQDKIYEALAVLGRVDIELLEQFLSVALSKQDVQFLSSRPDIIQHDNIYVLLETQADHLLEELKTGDLQRFTGLHESGVALLSQRLYAGDHTFESELTKLFSRLAETYYLNTPERLADLTNRLNDLPAKQSATRHNILYYSALSLRMASEHHASIAAIDELLAEDELELSVRARALNSQAISYSLLGQYAEARPRYDQSFVLWQKLDNAYQQSVILRNISINAYELHLYDEAESYLNRSLAIAEQIGSLSGQATTRLELGLVHRDRGNWNAALDCFNFHVSYWRSQQAWNKVGNSLNNIGEVQFFFSSSKSRVQIYYVELEGESES